MNWNSKKIRVLRLRLGWSQSDLARRLNCHWQLVHLWENAQNQDVSILETHQHLLDIIEKQAESEADHVNQMALAEVVLSETNNQQVDFASVKRRFSKSN